VSWFSFLKYKPNLVASYWLKLIRKFSYVKPVHVPKLTAFCKELTGIQQEWVDKGLVWKAAYKQVESWLASLDEKPSSNLFAFGSFP